MTISPEQREQLALASSLLDVLHKGAPWRILFTPDNKKSYFSPTNRPLAPTQALLAQNLFYGIHGLSRMHTGSESSRNVDVCAINAFPAEFDGKDIVEPELWQPLVAEHLPCLDGLAANKQRGEITKANNLAKAAVYAANPERYKAMVLAHIEGLSVKPHVILASGGGYQALWLLDETVVVTDENREYWRGVFKKWVASVGGDPASSDIRRFFRLPGSKNHKPKYGPNFPLARLLRCNLDQRCAVADLLALLPAEAPKRAPRTLHVPAGIAFDGYVGAVPFIKRAATTAAYDSAHDIHEMLLDEGYTDSTSQNRMNYPGGTSNSIELFPNNTAYAHSSSDALYCEHRVTPSHIATMYYHGGDVDAFLAANGDIQPEPQNDEQHELITATHAAIHGNYLITLLGDGMGSLEVEGYRFTLSEMLKIAEGKGAEIFGSVRRLGEATGQSKSVVSTQLTVLSALGLIVRDGSHINLSPLLALVQKTLPRRTVTTSGALLTATTVRQSNEFCTKNAPRTEDEQRALLAATHTAIQGAAIFDLLGGNTSAKVAAGYRATLSALLVVAIQRGEVQVCITHRALADAVKRDKTIVTRQLNALAKLGLLVLDAANSSIDISPLLDWWAQEEAQPQTTGVARCDTRGDWGCNTLFDDNKASDAWAYGNKRLAETYAKRAASEFEKPIVRANASLGKVALSVLNCLDKFGPCSRERIVRLTGCKLSRVAQATRRLEKHSLIIGKDRVYTLADDIEPRLKVVTLTLVSFGALTRKQEQFAADRVAWLEREAGKAASVARAAGSLVHRGNYPTIEEYRAACAAEARVIELRSRTPYQAKIDAAYDKLMSIRAFANENRIGLCKPRMFKADGYKKVDEQEIAVQAEHARQYRFEILADLPDWQRFNVMLNAGFSEAEIHAAKIAQGLYKPEQDDNYAPVDTEGDAKCDVLSSNSWLYKAHSSSGDTRAARTAQRLAAAQGGGLTFDDINFILAVQSFNAHEDEFNAPPVGGVEIAAAMFQSPPLTWQRLAA